MASTKQLNRKVLLNLGGPYGYEFEAAVGKESRFGTAFAVSGVASPRSSASHPA